IEPTVDERVTLGAGVAQEDTDLAVLDAPGRARVLALHADRMCALLHKTGLVQHEHGLRIAPMLDHVGAQGVAHPVRLPARASQDILNPSGVASPAASANC